MSSTHQSSLHFDLDPSGQANQPMTSTTKTPGQCWSYVSKDIDAMIKSNLPSRVKLREPNTFDGSDPKKLHSFLLQGKLNFWDWKDLFQDDTMKVNYVLSYLKGIALVCLNMDCWKANEPAWLSDFDLFSQELLALLIPLGKPKPNLKDFIYKGIIKL